MSQCLRAAETMFDKQFLPPVMPMFKRKSFDETSEQILKRQAVMSPMERQAYPAPRSFGSQNASTAQPVSIQPRPSPNGYAAASPSVSAAPVSVTPPVAMPPGRKRGRPSKADKEARARARANVSQSAGYTPITPAPIAPLPAPPTPQQTYSPSPSATSAYQISSESAPEPKPNKKSRPPAPDNQQQSEDVPRSVQGMVTSSESAGQQTAGPEVGLEYRWRDNALREDQKDAGRNSGPVPLEPPIQTQRPAAHQPLRDSHMSLATAGVHRATAPAPAMEHAMKDGHPRVANQA